MGGIDRGGRDDAREVIARFSWLFFTLCALVWFFLLWWVIQSWQELFIYPHPETRFHRQAGFNLVLLIPFLAWSAIAGAELLYFFALNKGDALWLEEDRLVYADRKKLDTPIGNVGSVVLGYHGARLFFPKLNPVLVFRLRNGNTASVRVNPLAGNKEDIIAALEAKLGLTVEIVES
jgi:hypothetical protein